MSKIIDADSHFIPLDVFKYVSQENKNKLPLFSVDEKNKLAVDTIGRDPNTITGNPLPPNFHNDYSGFHDAKDRLADFERLGINFQILNPQEHAMRFGYCVDETLAVEMAYSYNRVLLETIQQYPEKYAGPILLPLQDIKWCLSEIDWAIENGIYSVILDTSWAHKNSQFIDLILELPGIEEIFRKCHDNDILINFHHQMHQISFLKNPIFRKYLLHSLFPTTQQLLLVSLVTSGVFSRYPKLKVLISEGGMPFILKSFDYLEKINQRTIDFFKANLWFTIETEQTVALKKCVEKFGSERFLFATDYPHNDHGGQAKFIDHKLIQELGFSEDQINNMCYKNSKELYRLSI
jgi:predicted TIM-barrel fold metal-dependent hydrolase